MSSDKRDNHACQATESSLCMKSDRASAVLGPEIVEGHELQLMHTAVWGEIQPQTLSHYIGTSFVTEEGIRVSSNAANSVYFLLVLSHKVFESTYLYCLVFTSFKDPYFTTTPPV